MPSLVALLAISPSYAVDVNNGQDLQTFLLAACNSNTDPYVFDLPSELVLEPDEVFVYPDPSCPPNPPDLIFQPQSIVDGYATVRLQAQTDNASYTLFTFTDGVSVTFRSVHLRGPTPGDPGTEDPEDPTRRPSESFTPECAVFGGQVRGIVIDSEGANPRGVLTVEDSLFSCLDAEADGTYPGSGGAIYANDAIVQIIDTRFNFNSADQNGGAIYVTGTQATNEVPWPLNIERSRFERNDALLGGAVSNDWVGVNTRVESSRLLLNYGALGAGGLDLIDQRDVELRRNEFDRQNPTNLDPVQEGGAVRVDSTGLYQSPPSAAERGQLVFTNNIVCGSWAGLGGGVFINSVPDVKIRNSIFAENGGLNFGGGIYIENEAGDLFEPSLTVLHNTFVGNEAGKTPDFVQPRFIYAIGGGAAAAFFGVNAEFRNNVVAYSSFGGGVFQEYIPFSQNGYILGDPLIYYNNLWYENVDGQGDQRHLTGDAANLGMHPSNLVDVDPQLAYLGLGEYNCVPEAFYPRFESPVVDAGGGPPENGVPGPCEDWADTDIPPDYIPDGPVDGDIACDIGAFGGEEGLYIMDRDLDGFVNIFDCDDTNAAVNPGVAEECDFVDNDCNGLVDDGIQSVWYPDADGDGVGQAGVSPVFSCDAVPGHVSSVDGTPINLDCDDTDPLTFEGAQELCDGVDNDCNGLIDDGLVFQLYFLDEDGDGFGQMGGDGQTYCAPPAPGYIPQGGDCNDASPQIYPGAPERCNNDIDDDCDGLVDAQDPDASAQAYYVDADGDGDGDANIPPIANCSPTPPDGFSLTNGDCNDASPEINSRAPELCNTQIDEDCDGSIDEADANTADARIYYPDADGDGFGNATQPMYTCDQGNPGPGFVLNADDCNDGDATVGDCLNGGCSTVGAVSGAGLFGWLAGAMALAGRRRR